MITVGDGGVVIMGAGGFVTRRIAMVFSESDGGEWEGFDRDGK